MGNGTHQKKYRLEQGDIVIVSSLFSDKTGKKLRPAIVLSNFRNNYELQDCIVIPLSTTKRDYPQIFRLYLDDVESGDLIQESYVRVDKIFSIDQSDDLN